MSKLLEENGISKIYLHDDPITPRDFCRQRVGQINRWLIDHPEIENYAVLDDTDMTEDFEKHMVHVSFSDGLLSHHYIQLIHVLGRA